MLIRLATPDEASILAEAWFRMFEEDGLMGSGAQPDWRGRLEGYFAASIRDGTHGWFVAEVDGRVAATGAGMLSVSPSALAFRDRQATVAGVYTWPQYRRRGYARAVTEAVVQWCRERGCVKIRLRAAEQARTLYESLGFVPGSEMVLDLSGDAWPAP